jgi:hypothetical protein
VALFHSAEDNVFVPRYTTCNQEEGCVRVVLAEYIQDSGSADRVWPIVNSESHHRFLGVNKIHYFGKVLREYRDDLARLEHEYYPHDKYKWNDSRTDLECPA